MNMINADERMVSISIYIIKLKSPICSVEQICFVLNHCFLLFLLAKTYEINLITLP